MIALPLGSVPLTDRTRIGVAVRAENLRVGRSAEACDARPEARLPEVIYRGTGVDHVLELVDGQRAVATSPRREIELGSGPVACGFNAVGVIALED